MTLPKCSSDYMQFLVRNSKIVASWPAWKLELFERCDPLSQKLKAEKEKRLAMNTEPTYSNFNNTEVTDPKPETEERRLEMSTKKPVLSDSPATSTKSEPDDALIVATTIHEHNLDADMISLPAYYATYSEKLFQATRAAMQAEADLEHTESRVFLTYKAKMTLNHDAGKAPAVAMVDKSVASDMEVVLAKVRVVETSATRERWRNVLRALDHKAQMLITLGANRRQEYQFSGGLNTKDRTPPNRYDGPVIDPKRPVGIIPVSPTTVPMDLDHTIDVNGRF